MGINEKSKVKVSYPGGKSHITTIIELRTKFQEETDSWKEFFFESLVDIGVFYSNSGKYELIDLAEKDNI